MPDESKPSIMVTQVHNSVRHGGYHRVTAALALYLTLAACSTPQTVIVHQPVAPPISAALTMCAPEPPKPPRTASDSDYAIWDAAAIYAGRDCRNVLGKLVVVLDAWRASIKEPK